MHQIQASSGDEAYLHLLRTIQRYGDRVAPRGQPTAELLDVTVAVSRPEWAPPLGVRTNFNNKIAATETVHLLGEMSSLEQLNAASGDKFTRYADGGRLLGAYGPRLTGQLERVVDQLRADPDTRQAVAVIWNRDEEVSRDTPCTVSLLFRVRNGRLSLKVHMRSNDAWLGVPYDWFVFSRLQLAVAEVLNLVPGPYVHHADSLHLYERDLPAVNTALERADAEPWMTRSPKTASAAFTHRLLPHRRSPRWEEWADVRGAARRVAFANLPLADVAADSPIMWYVERVPKLPVDAVLCAGCGYVVAGREVSIARKVVHSTGSSQVTISLPLCTRCHDDLD